MYRIVFFAILFIPANIVAQSSLVDFHLIMEQSLIPESDEARLHYSHLFKEPVETQMFPIAEKHQSKRDDGLVEFLLWSDPEMRKIYYVFKNAWNNGKGRLEYPLVRTGNFIIQRSVDSGELEQIKIFLRGDEGGGTTFLRVFPEGQRSRIDFYFFDIPVIKGLITPVIFERFLTASFAQIMKWTSPYIEWKSLFANYRLHEWEMVRDMTDQIRSYLPYMKEVYDGGINAKGEFVRIETGNVLDDQGVNCSGFAKWVADGIYRHFAPASFPLYMEIEKLKSPTVSYEEKPKSWTDSVREERDPYFGLDWSRNIAVSIASLQTGRNFPINGRDVNNISYFKYIKNVGYSIYDIRPILYLLAVNDPGMIYMGSVNSRFGDPPIHQHFHVALFFPYFDEEGAFHIDVMETGEETSLESLQGRYEDSYVHLVSLPSFNGYRPPPYGHSDAGLFKVKAIEELLGNEY